MFFKLFVLFSAVLIWVPQTNATTDKVICFFASWAGYRNGDGSFKPQHIDPIHCTHVFYAFLGVNSDGSLQIMDPWNDIDLGGFQNVNSLKQVNPNLKTLFSIGGWNAGHALLEGITASTVLRKGLIDSCLSFLLTYGYDGLDIDWEYPEDADKENFVTLLQEMRQAFDAEGYLISVTVSGTPLSSYDVPEITKVADLINIMSYDFNNPDAGVTGHNAPLYGTPSVNTSVHSWIDAGVDVEKLTLSVPFYGHSYHLEDSSDNGVGAPAEIGIGGPLTQSPGTVGYNEICAYYSDWTVVWDAEAQVPYSYSGTNWFSYDDPRSIGLKAKLAKDLGLAGVAVWSIDTDDFHGICGDPQVLLHAIDENINS